MTKALLLFVLAVHAQIAQVGNVTQLIQKNLPDLKGKEALMITVDIAPGQTIPAHRHNADVFAYVLKGTITTQIQGQAPKTLHAGEGFYEAPSDIHLPSRNLSKTQPAKLLVFFVKDEGTPPTVFLNQK